MKTFLIPVVLAGLALGLSGATGPGVVAQTPGVQINAPAGLGAAGYDLVAYFRQNAPVLGDAALSHLHEGVTYRFSSAENRAAFRADPAAYLPQYGSYCAYGVARGYKVGVDPAAFTIVDGKLYLNYDRAVQKIWRKDIPRYLARSEANWPAIADD
ncbi:YHS domain-containing (seleno)protein [Paracoccus nototheniae]|uniref:YHS domain-containing (Seleno)protein n=1 Tax=Paracoccus nototheniae TaxID=2489002 RepID=A0ABW4E326_9RHOB|nr:YHS domain-containing (seleno)protein [Paracoccus nototheniae]